MAINVKDKLVTLESLGVAYSAEQDAREEADQALSTRIDNIVAPEGDPSLTEVSDARVSGSTTHNTLKARLDADKSAIETEISQLSADLAPLTSAKSALLECLKHAKFDEDGHTYYDALEDALFPSASLESITAVYNPGQNTIYDITPLSELKRYITVTGNYEGGESKTLTAYTLSGTLVPGTNTITISAGSVTTTISVTAVRYWTYTWSYADGLPGNSGLVKETTGTVTETLESDGVRVAVENTSDKRARYYYSGLSSTQLYTEGIFELEFKVNAYGSYSVAPYGNGVRLHASLGNRNGNSVNTAQLAFNTSGVLYVKTGTINWTLLDNSAFELDTWYKVRIEQSLTKADVYVDGVFVGSILTADNKESVSRPMFTAYRGVDVTFKAFRMRVA